MVVPGVVHEGEALIDRGADEADAFMLVGRASDMMPAEAQHRYLLGGASQRPVEHVAFADGRLMRRRRLVARDRSRHGARRQAGEGDAEPQHIASRRVHFFNRFLLNLVS